MFPSHCSRNVTASLDGRLETGYGNDNCIEYFIDKGQGALKELLVTFVHI